MAAALSPSRVQLFAEAQAAAGADPEKVSPFSAKLNAATK